MAHRFFSGVRVGAPLTLAPRSRWGYLANRAIWHNKGKTATYGELFKEGDTIGVVLDLTPGRPGNGTLAFSRNGRGLGVAVDNLLAHLAASAAAARGGGDGGRGGLLSGAEGGAAGLLSGDPAALLFPAFSMYNRDDSLSLIPSIFAGGGASSGSGGAAAAAAAADHAVADGPAAGGAAGTAVAEELVGGLAALVADLGAFATLDDAAVAATTARGGAAAAVGAAAEAGERPPWPSEADAAARCLAQSALRWARRWQRGDRVPILTAHGRPLWCRTSLWGACELGGGDVGGDGLGGGCGENRGGDANDNEEHGNGANQSYGHNDDDDDDDDDDLEDSDDAAGLLGLSAGDVVEVASTPAAAPRRAFVLGVAEGRLWVAPSTAPLTRAATGATSAARQPGAAWADGEEGGGLGRAPGGGGGGGPGAEGGEAEVALWRAARHETAHATLAGAARAGSSSAGASAGAPSAAAATATADAGPVLRLRAGGFSLTAEPWTVRAFAAPAYVFGGLRVPALLWSRMPSH